jgi:YaiO family outer membrane protein
MTWRDFRNAVAVSALAAWVTAGAASELPQWQIEAGLGMDQLSNGAPDWNQVDVSLRRRIEERSIVELALRRTRRSDLVDEEIGASVGLPLDAQWSATVAAAASPSHNVLARFGGRIDLARSFEGGWVASATLGRRLYTDAGNSLMAVGVERYVGDWRLAAALGQNRLDGGDTAANARLQVDRSFAAERGRVGLILASGRELESVPATAQAPADVIDQRVNTVALIGTWALAAAWALTGEASHVRVDDIQRRSGAPAGAPYHRNGVRVGVRHDF